MQPRIITDLKDAIRQTHRCEAVYISTVHVREKLKSAAEWNGFVKVFKLIGHPEAKRCYAWSYCNGKEKTVTTILELSPVSSAETAISVANGTNDMSRKPMK
jgi:hypothetical protein